MLNMEAAIASGFQPAEPAGRHLNGTNLLSEQYPQKEISSA